MGITPPPPDIFSGVAGEIAEYVRKCLEKIPFEVYFLHATTLAELNNAETVIKAVPEGKYIHEDADAQKLILTNVARQYVNITTREDKWIDPVPATAASADPYITHLDRLGLRPRIVIRFIKKLPTKRVVAVELFDPSGANLEYNKPAAAGGAGAGGAGAGGAAPPPPAEVERNDNFQEKLKAEFTVETDGVLIIDEFGKNVSTAQIFINALGGNRYQVRGKDKLTAEESLDYASPKGTLEVWRYVWVQRVRCGDGQWSITDATIFGSLNAMITEYRRLFVEMNLELLPVVTTQAHEFLHYNQSATARADLIALITATAAARAKRPYLIAVAASRTIGQTARQTVTLNSVQGGPTGTTVTMDLRDTTGAGQHRLIAAYRNHDGTNFRDSVWLHRATFNGADITGLNAITLQDLHGNSLNNVSPPRYFIGSHISVDTTLLPDAVGRLVVELESFENAAAGFAWRNTGLAWVQAEGTSPIVGTPMRKRVSDATSGSVISNVMIHEIGHNFGMVCDGIGGVPDMPTNFYQHPQADPALQSHRGRHCRTGFVPSTPPSANPTSRGTCVMYGQASSTARIFCNDCSVCVRKIDCSAGWVTT